MKFICIVVVFAFVLSISDVALFGHAPTPVTHSFDSGAKTDGSRLILSISDDAGQPLAARFSIRVDGKEHEPAWIDRQGIRFTSIHRSKNQEFTTLYSRGTGPVTVGLPSSARNVEVTAARGLEYLPASVTGVVRDGVVDLRVSLQRWSNLADEGWIAVDEHLHYDRLDPSADADWLTMISAEGLDAGHFMVLKGGMMPGVWSRQFAYGPEGTSTDGRRMIIPGQEYRDTAQGHINLLGVNAVIEPISTGGIGIPPVAENYPPLHDVLIEARSRNAFAGVAHGATLGRSPTAMADAILGAVDFWEISNALIYSTDAWYRLMNCGIFLPPAAGTDLPNDPYRDSWQPMLGSTRTYVHTDGRTDFDAFKSAMKRGRVFITGDPIVRLTVDDRGPGESIVLPAGGGSVTVRAEVASPRPPREFRLVRDGNDEGVEVVRTTDGVIHRWRIEAQIRFERSGWLAVWASGAAVHSLEADPMAHSGAVRVLVGGIPVASRDAIEQTIQSLSRQREYYAAEGRYRTAEECLHALSVFDRAIERLRARLEPR